jgi:hypothetical protein
LPYGNYNLNITYLGDANYNKNSTKYEFTHVEPAKDNTAIDLNITVDENEVMVEVGLNQTATGLIKFNIVGKETGENYTMYIDVEDGYAGMFIDYIAPGNYTVVATYMGDSVFNTNTTSKDVEIIGHIMKDTPIDVTVETNKTNVTLTVKVDENATGFVEVKFGNNVFNIALENGEGILKTILPYGSYNLNITYLGDYNYNMNNTELSFNVTHATKEKPDADIDIEDKTGSTPSLKMNLPQDATGNVLVYVNDVMSQVVEVVNGSAIIVVPNLIIGDNKVKLVYSGDANYDPINESFILNRKATVMASDRIRGYNSGLDYTAKLFDDAGSPLANVDVTIKVGTNAYVVKTDSDGVLNFNNRLAVGDYPVVIYNPVTGEYKLTNLKIVGRITDNKDLTCFFADGSSYSVRIIGDDGNYVGAGEVVQINVGGKTYSVVTDANGYATLKLGLKAKKYTITVTYKGFTAQNKVTVKSVVKPLKKTVKVKKTAKKLKTKVKLKGKKVLKKKRVYMKFKGKTYKAKTNKKGIATFKVPKKVIKKLKKGKKYKAVFTYKAKANGKTIKDTAKCYVKVK